MFILKHLEPYRHYTFDELMKLQEKQLLNQDSLKIKINFSTFVDRFERENMNIIEFGSQLDFDKKISIINEKFKEYVREYQETEDKEEKEDIGYLLKKELRDSAAFAAFKRWLIWDNEMFSEIEQFIPEN